MPHASPAQGTLKRLIEAEDQAREILTAAEKHAEETIAQAANSAGSLSRLFASKRRVC
jgi:vacuolar-type H+-ATPase subunit H